MTSLELISYRIPRPNAYSPARRLAGSPPRTAAPSPVRAFLSSVRSGFAGGVRNAWSGRARVLGFPKIKKWGITVEIKVNSIYAIVWRNE